MAEFFQDVNGTLSQVVREGIPFLLWDMAEGPGGLKPETIKGVVLVPVAPLRSERGLLDREDLAKKKELSAKAPQIEIAEARKADLEKAMAEITEQGTGDKLAWVKKERTITDQIEAERSKLEQIEAGIDWEAEGKIANLNTKIQELHDSLKQIEAQITEKRDALARIKGEIVRISEAEKERSNRLTYFNLKRERKERTIMKKILALVLSLIFVQFGGLALAQDKKLPNISKLSTYGESTQRKEIGDWKIWCCFDKPCEQDPRQPTNLFGYSTKYFTVG